MTARTSILCVDDEPHILNTISLLLEKANYDVFTAANVPDAIRLLNSHPIDLVLFDRVADRGWLAIEARRLNPQTRLLFCTDGLEGSELPWLDGVIQKPVVPIELLRAIDEVLHSRPAGANISEAKEPADPRAVSFPVTAVKPQTS